MKRGRHSLPRKFLLRYPVAFLCCIQALGLFLDQRRSCLALHLTNPGSNGADSVAALFEEVAGALQVLPDCDCCLTSAL